MWLLQLRVHYDSAQYFESLLEFHFIAFFPCLYNSTDSLLGLEESSRSSAMAVSEWMHHFLHRNLPFPILSASAILLLLFLFRFAWKQWKARYQFPGPPVKNLWIGNLDQTLTDDVHDRVRCRFSYLRISLTMYGSGSSGIGNMDMCFRL